MLVSHRSLLALAIVLTLGCGQHGTLAVAGAPGVSSQAYLLASTPAMVVEVFPTAGHQPSPAALDLLKQRIQERCNKPGGVTITVEPEVVNAPGSSHEWTYEDLVAFENQHATDTTTSSAAVLSVFYLAGGYGPNPAAIAISYTGHSCAIFTDKLGAQGPEGPALVHELGHQLGLVNGTTPMLTPHVDPHSLLHDVSAACVMYFSLDPRSDAAAPSDYCDHCKQDLQAVGGK